MMDAIKKQCLARLALQLGCFSLMMPGIALAEGMGWLQGNWCLTTETQSVEEVWSSDVAGNLIGMSRTVTDGKVVSFEFMRIVTDHEGTHFIAQPGGGAATTFSATEVSRKQIKVENRQHDFPQRIVYRREGESLSATISGPDEGGQEMSFSYTYQPCNHSNTVPGQ